MLIYISGPMTGYPDLNRQAFANAAKHIVEKLPGSKVLNPHDLDAMEADMNKPNEFFYRRDLKYLLQCDAVVVLPGWQFSRGAKLEVIVAKELGMPIYELDGNLMVRHRIEISVIALP